jgi:hypothetical protein
MPEMVSHSLSNLVPLLILVLVVFGLVIGAAIFLRNRIGKDLEQSMVHKPESVLGMADGDVCTVLGRAFEVKSAASVQTPQGSVLWCDLEGEKGPIRLLLWQDHSQALYFPAQVEHPGQAPFPDRVVRDQDDFSKSFGPLKLESGQQLALYQGAQERVLAIECRDEKPVLWRGKSIPFEGISLLQEPPKKSKS